MPDRLRKTAQKKMSPTESTKLGTEKRRECSPCCNVGGKRRTAKELLAKWKRRENGKER